MFTLVLKNIATNEKFSKQFKTIEELELYKASNNQDFIFETIDENQAKIQNDIDELVKKTDHASRASRFKTIDWTTVDTIEEIKEIVKLLVQEITK